MNLTIADIKAAANARMFDVLAACGIHESPGAGGFISMRNPMRKDANASFTIWTKGGFLAFKDHTDDTPGGTRGDVLLLVSYLNGWLDRPKRGLPEACRFLTELLALERVSPAQLAADRAASQRRAAEQKKKSDEERARNEGRAMEMWLNAQPLVGSRPDTYLRLARGIDIGAFPKGPRGGARLPTIIRALDAHEHVESGQRLPCMIAGCVDFALEIPRIRAVHRTWLKHDGTDKADVEPQRKVWPSLRGLVIPVWRGSNGSIKEAIANGVRETLVLTEGIEDGLTAALANPDHRVWAVIALGNLGNVPVPECCDGIIVHRQNDWLKRQAVESFERGKAALAATGRPVVEVAASSGKDLNDTLRGEH